MFVEMVRCCFSRSFLVFRRVFGLFEYGVWLRVRAARKHMRVSAGLAYESRRWAMLSCTQQDTLAATLADDAVILLEGHDAAEPELSEVLVDELHTLRFGWTQRQ